jgi:hypothetical protein
MDKIKQIVPRALAVAVVAFLGSFTISVPLDLDAWVVGLATAGSALVVIIRDLAIFYANDGELTDEEIEEAFRYVKDEGN